MSQHSADPLMKKIVSKIVIAAEAEDMPPVPQPMAFPLFEDATPYGQEQEGAAPLDEELEKAKALAPVPEPALQDAESRTQELKATHEEEGLRRDIDTLAASLSSLEEQYASRAVTLQYEGLASQMQSKQRKLDKLQKKRTQTQERLVDENIENAQQARAAINPDMVRTASMPQGIAGSELF
jgi:hypothetical protein